MWTALTSWITLAILIPAIIFTGLGVLSMSPPGFTIAHICFSLAAILLSFRLAWWIVFEQSIRHYNSIIFGFIIFGIIGAAWIASMNWITTREIEYNKKVLVSPPEITLRRGTNKSFNLKVTNNKDESVFDVNFSMCASQKLDPCFIRIDPIEKEVAPGIPFCIFRTDFSIGCSTIILPSINPHTTKEFAVKIDGSKITNDLKISFSVYDWSSNPSLFDFATKPFKEFPQQFDEFFKDKSKESEKTAHVFAQKFKTPTNPYFPEEKEFQLIRWGFYKT